MKKVPLKRINTLYVIWIALCTQSVIVRYWVAKYCYYFHFLMHQLDRSCHLKNKKKYKKIDNNFFKKHISFFHFCSVHNQSHIWHQVPHHYHYVDVNSASPSSFLLLIKWKNLKKNSKKSEKLKKKQLHIALVHFWSVYNQTIVSHQAQHHLHYFDVSSM